MAVRVRLAPPGQVKGGLRYGSHVAIKKLNDDILDYGALWASLPRPPLVTSGSKMTGHVFQDHAYLKGIC